MSKPRICVNCEFHRVEMIQGPQSYQKIILCTHENCQDLVSGDLIPAAASRREEIYCGISGRYYKQKIKEPNLKVVPKEADTAPSIIQVEGK